MNTEVQIISAEHKFKQILETFFITIYDENSLSSHGLDHHRRVWHYAKELLRSRSEQQKLITADLPSKLIIASYLHDIGMSIDYGVRHGNHSKEICIQFLQNNNLHIDEDVLEAISLHDIKDYSSDIIFNDVLSLLSPADDLDALGFIGIFRYLEIYLVRGIEYNEIGNSIIDNAVKRYENFVKAFSFDDLLIEKHKNKYDTLVGFFNEYNNQILSYQFGGKKPVGHCGVAEIILTTIKQKRSINNLFRDAEIYFDDHIIRRFFEELEKELKC